jgi:hypothetical protein
VKAFLDTEFIEDGKTIDLISIGIVRENDTTFYAISSEFDESKADVWVRENVLIHLPPPEAQKRYPRSEIAAMIREFFWDDLKPQFWGYYCDYDWVAFCQLYGKMIELPEDWPRYCRDLKQLADDVGIKLPQPIGVEHHALADAQWIKEGHAICQEHLNRSRKFE